MNARFSLFATAIGDCGIAWRDERIIATYLPARSPAATANALAARAGASKGDPPAVVQRTITAIGALFEGSKVDLSTVDCDFSGVNAFARQVYVIARQIPPGETMTYGEIALQLGDKQQSRAVGRALGQNPFPIIVPCHRVLGANGKLTGFSAYGGVETKLKMLQIEGARVGPGPGLFDGLLGDE